jgi:hypothetical protein
MKVNHEFDGLVSKRRQGVMLSIVFSCSLAIVERQSIFTSGVDLGIEIR